MCLRAVCVVLLCVFTILSVIAVTVCIPRTYVFAHVYACVPLHVGCIICAHVC